MLLPGIMDLEELTSFTIKFASETADHLKDITGMTTKLAGQLRETLEYIRKLETRIRLLEQVAAESAEE